MAKKNKGASAKGDELESSASSTPPPSHSPSPTPQKIRETKQAQSSTSALIICRNKHWRYISSFHGPWLQLPPSLLESLANNNYSLPRPRPIDPAVFFDLLKIRQLVDDATNLSVRAASGVASSIGSGNNGLGNGGALGFGIGGGGGTAKLSRERKHRMREQATQKLARAYRLDEIACSVATMQSASTLEEVANLVLQRNPDSVDAKYVHFFHEKIPSRHLAECTSLRPLDEVILERPNDAEPLRTRAVTKVFKEDFLGAAQDLTTALQICRYQQGLHKASNQQLQVASAAAEEAASRTSRRKDDIKIDEEDQPSSLESQLLFQRAGVYLTIACQHVNAALPLKSNTQQSNTKTAVPVEPDEGEMQAEKEAEKRRLEARKIVKSNAKRALRDYLSYLSHLDYTPGLEQAALEEFVSKQRQASSAVNTSKTRNGNRMLDMESNASLSNGQLSDALVPHTTFVPKRPRSQNGSPRPVDFSSFPSVVVYQMSTLFSATPPSDLPPYPEMSLTLVPKSKSTFTQTDAFATPPESQESLTYHPLLTDALHSLLICHCLIQTSPRELQRHAHMVARLARLCDGYPVFQAARSPSRGDWVEILRRTDNWIQLSQSWETLCAPAPLPGSTPVNQQKETPQQKQERLKHQAVLEALEDDRVHDEASFQAAVAARQRRQDEEARKAEGKEIPKRWTQEDASKDYPISSDRAQAVVRWILEAPLGGDDTSGKKKKKGSKAGNAKGKEVQSVEKDMTALQLDEGEKQLQQVEEEVD